MRLGLIEEFQGSAIAEDLVRADGVVDMFPAAKPGVERSRIL
jgi:hypothetical protein